MRDSSEQALRTATTHIDSIEIELGAARAALADARAALDPDDPVLVPAAYTTEQVARLLGLSRSTVAQMIRSGELVSVKLGGSRRILPADLNGYLTAQRVLS
jgi:excisionase family DNA binding protein